MIEITGESVSTLLTFRHQSFKQLLQAVVFGNARPGASRIALNQFVILSARTGQPISRGRWLTDIKSGDHIQQAMIMPDTSSRTMVEHHTKCLYVGCDGTLESPDSTLCGIWCGLS